MAPSTTLWPDILPLDDATLTALMSFRPSLDLPAPWLEQWESVWRPLTAYMEMHIQHSDTVPVIGIHGGQGSGKSTLSRALQHSLKQVFDRNVVIVSIDDLYLTYADRQKLANDVHPLLATRGVPGTHEVEFGQRLFSRLRQLKTGESLRIPAFDKASDDRLPESEWHQVNGPVDAVLFEGWCVGCEAVSDEQLATPMNALEANEDADGQWRRWVNAQLATRYHDWFAMLDALIMLKVPDMSAVTRWRTEQEEGNKAQARGQTDRSLDDAALERFIQHYERLTRQALTRLPEIATLVLDINSAHQVDAIHPEPALEKGQASS